MLYFLGGLTALAIFSFVLIGQNLFNKKEFKDSEGSEFEPTCLDANKPNPLASDDVDSPTLEKFRQEFQASINGVQNSFRTPLMGISPNEKKKIKKTSKKKKSKKKPKKNK